jgi:hypothetical protein
MANEIIEVNQESTQLLNVSKRAIDELKQQRSLLSEFVKSQLIEADFSDKYSASYGEGDFGIIPGTKKRCLFKPGAEKILRLFGLGARFKLSDKEIDKCANFALYTYQCEIYLIRTGQVISSCEATANSQEIKYKEKTEWKTNAKGIKESTKVETPIFDILNTLQKMAQKRALVGATLLATGASEYFTQDMLEPEDIKPEEPKDVTPKAETQEREEMPQESQPIVAPICCGRKMMISKYADESGNKPLYCVLCKKKVAAQ